MSISSALSVVTTVCSVTYVGGFSFLVAAALVGVVYWNGQFKIVVILLRLTISSVAKIYGQTSRDMRRLGESFVLTSQLLLTKRSQTRSLGPRCTPSTARRYQVSPRRVSCRLVLNLYSQVSRSSVHSALAPSSCATCCVASTLSVRSNLSVNYS